MQKLTSELNASFNIINIYFNIPIYVHYSWAGIPSLYRHAWISYLLNVHTL